MNAPAPVCPTNGRPGKVVRPLTLKALLTPSALATLDPEQPHAFCADPLCPVVYFSASRTYGVTDVRVWVFQKDPDPAVPVCYCFGYTRDDLMAGEAEALTIQGVIRAHIQAGRCACEVRNPQGTCCLGNVMGVARRTTAEGTDLPL